MALLFDVRSKMMKCTPVIRGLAPRIHQSSKKGFSNNGLPGPGQASGASKPGNDEKMQENHPDGG
jgi:hypothetical protein